MEDIDLKGIKKPNITDHLANERTFLAWIRTSLGIMAFGFVIEKFALFIKQITYFLSKDPLQHSIHVASTSWQGYSAMLGIFLVSVGTLMCILSFIKYKNIERQIDEDNYRPSIILDALLTGIVIFVGFFIALYLIQSF